MTAYRFVLADVFTTTPFGGNQLAVFTDARGLTAAQMQTLARELNLAETAFVLPPEIPGAAQRVRIFTTEIEMPFAGHPTIGTTFVLAREKIIPLTGAETSVILQLNIGPTPVTIAARDGDPTFVWMTQRPAAFGNPERDTAPLAHALGVLPDDLHPTWPTQIVSTGVPYLIVPLRSLAAVQRARPGSPALRDYLTRVGADQPMHVCAYLFALETAALGHTAHARMFDPGGLAEDAATGSAAGPLGAYLHHHHLTPPGPIIIEQGYEMNRPSLIHVEVTAAGIAVGGQAVIIGEGVINL